MKKAIIGIAVSLILMASIFAITDRIASAQDSSGIEIVAKLDEVLSNQKMILNDLAAIKDELMVIKVRISQNQ